MFDFITIGGATRDVFFKISEGKVISTPKNPTEQKLIAFEYGAKIIPQKAYFSFGGGGTNSAISFARLGFKVATCICIGKEGTGDLILENLKKAEADTRFVIRDPKLHAALSVILSVPSGERVAFRCIGADENLKIKNWNEITKTKWFYITSLRRKAAKLLDKIAKVVAKRKVKLAFNPGTEQIKKGYRGLKAILKVTSILILNKDEAIELVLSKERKIPLNKLNNTRNLLKILKNWGPKIVVITCGSEGAYASEDGEIYFAPAVKTKVIDTTGAGDAFGSSFVAGLKLYKDIKKALQLASLNAASVVSHFGAQTGLLKLPQIKKVKTKVKIKELKNNKKCKI